VRLHCGQRNRRSPFLCRPNRWQATEQASQVMLSTDCDSFIMVKEYSNRSLFVNDNLR
jgi:hypothetical protein